MTGASNGSSATGDYLGVYADEDLATSSLTFGSDGVVFGPTPRAGTVRNLYAQIGSSIPAGTTWQITVHAGTTLTSSANASTTVLCQITSASTSCNSAALASPSIPAGSYLTVRVTRTAGSGNERDWRYSFEY